jgi:hypothetical protein
VQDFSHSVEMTAHVLGDLYILHDKYSFVFFVPSWWIRFSYVTPYNRAQLSHRIFFLEVFGISTAMK